MWHTLIFALRCRSAPSINTVTSLHFYLRNAVSNSVAMKSGCCQCCIWPWASSAQQLGHGRAVPAWQEDSHFLHRVNIHCDLEQKQFSFLNKDLLYFLNYLVVEIEQLSHHFCFISILNWTCTRSVAVVNRCTVAWFLFTYFFYLS